MSGAGEGPRFLWSRFQGFSASELYEVLRLRSDVFVVEQACAFAEMDGRDGEAEHLRCLIEGRLAGTLRIFGPDEEGAARIGRVATAVAFRGRGLARAMMRQALERLAERHGPVPVKLSAQSHLEAFYASLGFLAFGEPYLEDGIAHIDMRRDALMREEV